MKYPLPSTTALPYQTSYARPRYNETVQMRLRVYLISDHCDEFASLGSGSIHPCQTCHVTVQSTVRTNLQVKGYRSKFKIAPRVVEIMTLRLCRKILRELRRADPEASESMGRGGEGRGAEMS